MTYIPEALRQQVRERAKHCCEYCLLHERYALKTHEVDHIRAEKHGGTTVLDNLCLSCFECNRQKGSDLSSVDPVTDKGRVTVRLLDFNNPERVAIRAGLMALRRYPSDTDQGR